jgi:uncharacterized Ntn-hydrolase superfamily protein
VSIRIAPSWRTRVAGVVCATALLSPAPASASWSIVAIDQSTGTIAMASAACVAPSSFAVFPAQGLMPLQAIVVPGKGAGIAVASVDRTRANHDHIFVELDKGTDPQRIIDDLTSDPQAPYRQFGVVDFLGRAAAFSGDKIAPQSLDRSGRLGGTGITYVVQGNWLASRDVVLASEAALGSAAGPLVDRVMAALEAGDAKGGDRRCGCDQEPPVPQCGARTSRVAYLLRAEAGDGRGSGVNDGRYSMYLPVTERDLDASEGPNPVKALRVRYEQWKKAHPR